MKKRDVSLDLIRCVAFFCVVSVHFMLNNGYYQAPMVGKEMFIMSVMRAMFSVCVPLFIVLTGYLQCHKSVEKKYYIGIKETLCIYILASIASVIYKTVVLAQDITPKDAILGILNYDMADYAWYIEMYIGLFLLIPFFNLIWKGLESKKKKKLLILTVGVLTALPCVINIFSLTGESGVYNQIIPSWWQNLYPFLYYFIGCYLREYEVKMNRLLNVLLFAVVAIATGAFIYYYNYGKTFVWGVWQRWESLPFVVLTVLLFVFLKGLPVNSLPNWCKKGITALASLCLGGYLVSSIFDNYFYKGLIEKVPATPERLKYYFVMVPLVFVCSLALSLLLRLLYLLLDAGVGVVTRRKKRTEEKENEKSI